MDSVEALALEVKQYIGLGLKTLVPKIIGLTAAVKEKKSGGSRESRQWDEPLFFMDLESRRGIEESKVARKILEWTQARQLRIWWGKGKKDGSLFPILDYRDKHYLLFTIWTYGRVQIQFQMIRKNLPFSDEQKSMELLRRFNEIPAVSLTSDTINRYPSIPLLLLRDDAMLNQFLGIFDWVIQEIKSESNN